MADLLDKLNYKEQGRIAVINAEEKFIKYFSDTLKNVIIDQKIDPRYPYNFIVLFVKTVTEVNHLAPLAVHNLLADGILWFCYPKKTSKKHQSEIDRDHGWKSLTNAGLRGVRMISVDDDWSGLRFRNVKFIKSAQKQ